MAYQDAHFASSRDVIATVAGGLRNFFFSLGHSIVLSTEASRRLHLVQDLQSKTDEELAALNLKRDDIVREVFGDLFYS